MLGRTDTEPLFRDCLFVLHSGVTDSGRFDREMCRQLIYDICGIEPCLLNSQPQVLSTPRKVDIERFTNVKICSRVLDDCSTQCFAMHSGKRYGIQ